MTNRIPPKRQAVLDFCKAEVLAGRPFPGPTAITAHMGWRNSGSASDTLSKLAYIDKALRKIPLGGYAFIEVTA